MTVDAVEDKIERGLSFSDVTFAWATDLKLIPPTESATEHFWAIASGPFATLGWPSASPEYHQLISDSLCTFFLIDDMCDGDAPAVATPHPDDLRSLFAGLILFWRTGDAASLPRDLPLCEAMKDIRRRLLRIGASASWLDRFAVHFRLWLAAIDQEASYKTDAVVPDPVTLMNLRPTSGGVFLFMDFIELSNGTLCREGAPPSEELERLSALASRIIIYPNELLSHDKESAHGHAMNLLTSLIQHEGMSLERASRRVVEAHNDDMRTFEALASEARRGGEAPPSAEAYIRGLEHYMHGLFTWGWHAKRYSRQLFTSGAVSQRRPHSEAAR